MLKQTKSLVSVVVLAVLLMVGCGKQDNVETSTSKETTDQVTITDTLDRQVEVKKNPKKVVVFDMGSLDTIQALGQKDSVIAAAVDNLPSYLSEYQEVESAGGIKEPDMEKINALQPDLIIISGRQQDYLEELEKIAPTLYLAVDTTDTWNSTKNNINSLAQIFDAQDEAKAALAKLDTRIDTLKETTTALDEKALVVLVNEGQLSAYGQGSRFGIVHDVFGFKAADEAIEASTHGQSASFEYVLEKNPDILFVIDRTKAIGGDETNNDLTKSELVAQTNAAKNNKIISLTADVWYLSGGGIQSTNLMLDDVQKALK